MPPPGEGGWLQAGHLCNVPHQLRGSPIISLFCLSRLPSSCPFHATMESSDLRATCEDLTISDAVAVAL